MGEVLQVWISLGSVGCGIRISENQSFLPSALLAERDSWLKGPGQWAGQGLWSLWNLQHPTACGLLVSDPLGGAGHTPQLGMAGPCHSFIHLSSSFVL